MDAVRGTKGPPLARLGSGDESRIYTEEWLRGVEVPEAAHSLVSRRHKEPIAGKEQQRFTQSAPALSIRSGASSGSVKRSRLELELKYLREKQNLDKEQRELELQAQKHAMEQRAKLAELQAKRRVHELESRLAEAQLQEELEQDDDLDVASNYDEELQGLSRHGVDPQAAVGNEGDDNHYPEAGEGVQTPTVIPAPQRAPELPTETARLPINPNGRQTPIFAPREFRPQPSRSNEGPQNSSRSGPTQEAVRPEVNNNQRQDDGAVRDPTVVNGQQTSFFVPAESVREPFNLEGRKPPVFIPQQLRPAGPPFGEPDHTS